MFPYFEINRISSFNEIIVKKLVLLQPNIYSYIDLIHRLMNNSDAGAL